jgi:signal transduction histidine kinase
MSRWKLFPSKTSRKISILLTLGMLVIYIGSMFVYSIYEYPKRFAPDPIIVENDFVHVVKLSRFPEAMKDYQYWFHGKSLQACVMTSAQLTGTATNSTDCQSDNQLGQGIHYKEIKQFDKNYLRKLQQKNIDKYRFKIKLPMKVSRAIAERDLVRAILLARVDAIADDSGRFRDELLRGEGYKFDITQQQPLADEHPLDADMNLEKIRAFVAQHYQHFNYFMVLPNDKGFLNIISEHIAPPRWLVIQSIKYHSEHPPVVMTGFIFSGLSFLLAIIILCFWAVRSTSVPVNKFLFASRRFGRDLQAPPMAVEGSREMREVIIEYNNMQEKIRRLVLDRTQMLAAISHDLRTPITRLLMRIEYLQGSEQYDKAVKDLKEMDQMIRSILAFARDYAANEVMEKFELGALLESICNDLVDTKLDVEYLSWDMHKVFYGRVNALRRAISNVIENAVKYGDKAYVQMELKQGEVQIKVKDCGPGIPEVEMEKVFAPFYRVDPARNPEKGGSGLGLAVSRDIIRSHAGDVKLYNSDEPGMGLLVVMHLPVSD